MAIQQPQLERQSCNFITEECSRGFMLSGFAPTEVTDRPLLSTKFRLRRISVESESKSVELDANSISLLLLSLKYTKI
jgi:hypothetical protein